MSAGLAVVRQVSYLNEICWIWSSGVVINPLKFSQMERKSVVSKVFSRIESLQVDIKSLKHQNVIDINNPSPTSIRSLVFHGTGFTIYVETGDFPRGPLGILKKGKNRILYFPSGRSSFESLNKIKELYNQRKIPIPRLLVPIFKKAIIVHRQISVSNGSHSTPNLFVEFLDNF